MAHRRILIGYDETECAASAVEDLSRAGLRADAEALVVTLAEVWIPAGVDPEAAAEGSDGDGAPPVSTLARNGLRAALATARAGAERLRSTFPGWTVTTRIDANAPAWGILSVAEEWQPDLIVVGSHGRGALGRLVLGSVSQKLLMESPGSVRIARGHGAVEGSPIRIVVGVDGTPDSLAAVDEIASRPWPDGTSVRVIGVDQRLEAPLPPADPITTEHIVEGIATVNNQIRQAVHGAAAALRSAGLIASEDLLEGSPAAVLADQAREWGADAIFIGARGHRLLDRILLGSVSASVATRAHCSVEVIRTGARA